MLDFVIIFTKSISPKSNALCGNPKRTIFNALFLSYTGAMLLLFRRLFRFLLLRSGTLRSCLFVFSLLFSSWSQAALPVTLEGEKLPSLSPMLKKITPAVVNISAQSSMPSGKSPLLDDPAFRQFYDRLRPSERRGRRSLGTGTIVDAKNGYILTNQHVVEGGDTILVILKNGRKLNAKLIGADPKTDIALLQVKAKKLTAIPIADSSKLEVGDFVIAIGSPYGLTQTVTSGIVSALQRSRLGFQGFENFIQTDAATNPGNSGGPLVNLRGELVGINTAILSPRGSNVGIGFAIPGNMAKAIMSQIIEYGGVKRGVFGINVEDLSYELIESMQLEQIQGALINKVKADSPAALAGLRVGDVITVFNKDPVQSANHLHNMLGLLRIGDPVKLVVLRDGVELQFAETTADPYKNYVAGASVSLYLEGARLSNFVDEATENAAEDAAKNGKLRAIAIGDIEVGSSAWRVGLREGDIVLEVNKMKVTDLKMMKQLLDEDKPMFHLRLQRDGELVNLISPS